MILGYYNFSINVIVTHSTPVTSVNHSVLWGPKASSMVELGGGGP